MPAGRAPIIEHQPRQPFRRAGLGALLSLGSPLGWILVEALLGGNPLHSLRTYPGVYVYMTVGTMLVFTGFGFYVGRNENKLALLAIRDPLTGLYNNRFFQERVYEAFAAGKRNQRPLTLVQIDLDYFKRVNDEWGHPVGNDVLRTVGAALTRSSRVDETVARVGGEEFCVILEGADENAGVLAARRFHDAIRRTPTAGPKGPLAVTASMGVACSRQVEGDAGDLYQASDQALYRAKQAGRDQICRFSEADQDQTRA